MVSRAGRMLLGIATSAIVVRGLGSHDYGVLSLLRSILMFVVLLAGVGTGQAILKFLPELRVQRSPRAARTLVRDVFATHALVWLVLLGAAFAGRSSAERVFHVDGVGLYLLVAVALALFEVVFTVATQVLNASYDVGRLAIAALEPRGVRGRMLVAFGNAGASSGAGGGCGGNAVACAMVWMRARGHGFRGRRRGGRDAGAHGRPAVTRDRVLRYCFRSRPSVLNFVWRQSETLMLAHFRSPEETGYFDLAYRLPQTILEFVPGTVWPLVMAGCRGVRARSRESAARHRKILSNAVRAVRADLCGRCGRGRAMRRGALRRSYAAGHRSHAALLRDLHGVVLFDTAVDGALRAGKNPRQSANLRLRSVNVGLISC
jgi:O-antigen/teichoic acid export membrane protein